MLTLILKVKIIYAAKDDTEIKLHIVSYLGYFARDGWLYKRPITLQSGDN